MALRVLHVDDDTQVRTLLAVMLRYAGDFVEEEAHGETALKRLQESPAAFDLLITDTRMPGLDGYQLVEAARAAGYEGKIIVFAGALSETDRELYRRLAVDYVIDKPAQHGELAAALRELRGGQA